MDNKKYQSIINPYQVYSDISDIRHMDTYIINGPCTINGEVKASGSKNAALPILAGCILTDEECILENVPDLKDIRTMIQLLIMLGKKVKRKGSEVHVTGTISNIEAPYELVRKMRASISVLGPLLAKEKEARVSFPGGCALGPRPVDLHIKGLEALGGVIEVHHGYIYAKTPKLIGASIHLAGPFGSSVLATDNVLMAAVLAEGETVIEAAAMEPEVVDVCNFLIAMGAEIEGVGTGVLKIHGVEKLHGCRYRVIPDRIESGTLLIAAACTAGEIRITNTNSMHLNKVLEVLRLSGAQIEEEDDSIFLKGTRNILPIEIETLPYPEFPTDMQAPLMALLSKANGISVITEKIYPDRFIHVAEFARMGAEIKMEGASAVIKGVPKLEGAPIMASDLRAGAALVIAALSAEGTSTVRRVYHIDRGYEKLEDKLNSLGASIKRGYEKMK